MNWNKIKSRLGKGYSWIWDHLEPIKSTLLSVMIVLSIFLTWNLWTYTPKLQVLDDKAPTVSDVDGEKMLLKDVIQPSKVILHQDGKHYWTSSPSQLVDGTPGVYKRLQNEALLVDRELLELDDSEKVSEGFEIIYPTPIPMPVLRGVFEFSGDNPFSSDIGTVKSLKIYKKNETDWMVRFLREPLPGEKANNQIAYEFQITEVRNFSNIVENFKSDQDRQEVQRFELNNSPFYLPTDPVEVQEYIYQIKDVSIDAYLDVLIPKDSVEIGSRGNTVAYSDWKSSIRYFKDQEEFVYTSPSSKSNVNDRLDQPIIMRGIDFINTHKGWTDEFHLYRYANLNTQFGGQQDHEEMLFRMNVNDLPVMGRSISIIELEYTNQEVYRYERSLLQLTRERGENTVELESGAEVINALEQISATNVKDITIGYDVVEDEDNKYSIKLIPGWYYKVGSTWLKVNFDIKEPFKNTGG